MQEHPIPQDITGYRFHIIGSMTLKQFGEILIGVIFGFIFFKTNLIAVIKWPLVLLSVGMGAAAAFVPIEERPLDHWIITFFRIMYKPTKFYWKRVPTIPDAFKYVPLDKNTKEEPTLDLTPAKRQRIKEYVSAIPEVSTVRQDFTNDELSRMQNILTSFTTVQVTETVVTATQPAHEKPRMDVRVRKMRKPALPEVSIFEDTNTVSIPTLNVYQKEEPILVPETKKSILKSDQVAGDIEIPEEQMIRTISDKDEEEKLSDSQHSINDSSAKSYIEPEAQNTTQTIAVQDAQYNQDLPFPIKPSEPNKVVGMVLSQNNDLLTNAIVEIQTPEGSIARAVKTNTLGQFFITTPLKNGDYNIVVEKTGYQFQPQHLIINNTIIPPMEIRSDN
ncbi:PrgI family protein [Candidatus Woesebacteria bacterium]|nr:PrgI family protein [Candidatus Woesebacteria bacterium]